MGEAPGNVRSLDPQATGAPTEVDVKVLEDAVEALGELRDYVNKRLVGDPAARLKLEAPGQSQAANGTNVIFGCFPAGTAIATKHNQFYDTVVRAYGALVESLEGAGEGTRRIAETYRTTEERNRAAVADITRLLSGGEPAPGGTSTAAVSPTAVSPTSSGGSARSAEVPGAPPAGEF